MRALRRSSCLLRTHNLIAVAAACWTMTLCSCGASRSKAVPVAGQVLIGEQPISNAVVIFHPINGKEDVVRPTGRTDEQGRFKLTTTKDGDGAPPGEYKVTITAYQSTEQPGTDSVIRNHLPDRYAKIETSNLTATVAAGKTEMQPFKLEGR